jgi:glycosyltransferase involved in cell wall biosynthesis
MAPLRQWLNMINAPAAVPLESADGYPRECELSLVMPCLDEAETLAGAIAAAKSFLERSGIEGEIVVADNGSSDQSPAIAAAAGARVVSVPARGYGNSVRGGIAAARGRYIIMGDPDGSYDFASIDGFVEKLRQGNDLVMGNRFRGGVLPGAMPALHRFVGNPLLSAMGRLFYGSAVGDFHCGLRGFSKAAVERMRLQTGGMELASEMVVKATLLGMRIAEVPTTLSPDGRSRPPHLRSWSDGWRHLRFLLLYSPRWLFLYPGLFLIFGGLVAGVWLLPGTRMLGRVGLDVHTLLYAAVAVEIGYQAVLFAVITKIFAVGEGLLPGDELTGRVSRWFRLETGILVGTLSIVAGLALSAVAVAVWHRADFGPLNPVATLRLVIPASVLLSLGFETILASFVISVLGLRCRAPGPS